MSNSKNSRGKKRRSSGTRVGSSPSGQYKRKQQSSEETTHSKTKGRLLERPAWNGIAALIGVLALIVPFALYAFEQIKQSNEAIAHVEVHHTFRRDSPGIWSIISTVKNRGPATADSLQMMYTSKNSTCFSGTWTQDENGTADFELGPVTGTGADCGGVELMDVEPASQGDMAGVFVRDFSSVSKLIEVGLTSGTIDSFKVLDTGWIEFRFRVASELDTELLQLVRSSNEGVPNEIVVQKFVDTFSVPQFQGNKVEVQEVEYKAIELLG